MKRSSRRAGAADQRCRGLAVIAALLAPLLAPSAAFACDGLVVSGAWIRQAPPGAMALAGYGTLSNRGAKPIRLDSFASGDFGSVELHESSSVDGQMRMRRATPLALAPGQSVTLAPGSYHLMLMQPHASLGTSSAIELQCDDGHELAADFPVRAAAPAP